MAFDLNTYLQKKFKNVEKTPESIKEAAQAILADPTYFSMAAGNTSPIGWAKSALMALQNIDDIKSGSANAYDQNHVDLALKSLDKAYTWITGAAQPQRAQHVLDRAKENKASLIKDLENDYSNIANVLDIPETASPELRARLEAKADAMKQKMADSVSAAQKLGLNVDKISGSLVRTANGYIPKSEATMSQGKTSHVGEPTVIRQGVDGKFQVVGQNSGKVYKDGLNNETEALAAQNLVTSGSTPQISGTTTDATPDNIAASRAGTLNTGTDGGTTNATGASGGSSSSVDSATSALESSVQGKEAAATAADSSLQVTPEMRAQWLAESVDELKGNKYYQEVIRNAEFDLGTTLNRAVEDTRQREMGLAQQYKENLTSTQNDLRDRGMLYGGVRSTDEKTLADKTNLALQGEDTTLQRNLQDTSQQYERYLGSAASSNFSNTYGNTQLVGRVLAGSPVFQPGANSSLFQYQGGNYGDLTRTMEEDARTRAQDKENAFTDYTSQYA